MFVVGLVGTFRAGKGAVVDFLLSQQGFTHYSVSEFLTQEIRRRGLPLNRDTMRSVANSLRREFGPACLVDTLYGQACIAGDSRIIIESLRSPAEVLRVKNLKSPHQGYVIGVDADQRVRWLRTVESDSVKDGITFEEFAEQERLEMEGVHPFEQNIAEALKLAHIIVRNEGSLGELHVQITKNIVPALKTRA